ncbi:Hypothetical predicted protein [Paramuricea clavata]|uniref:Uncharacterized protein n=1 Tax=Paramuricea clavata TaxID=317549 RepID=A0A7D9I6B0_PARCT|nr:Hypothetical predicted protein [Paramuricea clavata]
MGTKVGWVPSGPVTDPVNEKTSVNLVNTHVLNFATQQLTPDVTDMTQELRRLSEIESLGVFPNDESVYEKFTQLIKLKDKRYEVELLWTEFHPVLPDNHQQSEKRLKHLLTRLRKGGGFNLRKFFSNSPTLMNRINENKANLLADCNDEQDTLQTSEGINQGESRSSQTLRMEHDQSYTRETTQDLSEPVEKCEQKIFGVKWKYQEDCFVCDFGPIAQAAKKCEPTKRNIISIASKFYDPLGFISPTIVQRKLLFQIWCDSGID